MQRENNTMGKFLYLLYHGYWSMILYFGFSSSLLTRAFSPLNGELMSKSEAQAFLLGLIFFCNAVGIIAGIDHFRNLKTILLTVTSPFGIFLILERLNDLPVYVYICGCVVAIATCYWLVTMFSTPIRRGRISDVLWNRMCRLVHASRALTNVFLCIFVAVAMVGSSFGVYSIKSEPKGRQLIGDEIPYSLSRYESEFAGLRQENWEKKTIEGKVELLQLVSDFEAEYLGLSDQPWVVCEGMELSTAGTYAHRENRITINKDRIMYDHVGECLSTLFHELYHAFQHELVRVYDQLEEQDQKLYFLRNAGIYKYEFENYVSGHDQNDFWDYYTQAVEQSARQYSHERVTYYAEHLDLDWRVVAD